MNSGIATSPIGVPPVRACHRGVFLHVGRVVPGENEVVLLENSVIRWRAGESRERVELLRVWFGRAVSCLEPGGILGCDRQDLVDEELMILRQFPGGYRRYGRSFRSTPPVRGGINRRRSIGIPDERRRHGCVPAGIGLVPIRERSEMATQSRMIGGLCTRDVLLDFKARQQSRRVLRRGQCHGCHQHQDASRERADIVCCHDGPPFLVRDLLRLTVPTGTERGQMRKAIEWDRGTR